MVGNVGVLVLESGAVGTTEDVECTECEPEKTSDLG